MPALWGDSWRVICFPGNSVLLEMIGSGLSSRRKEKITPSCKGRGADESAHLRQQQTPTTTSMFTGTHLSSRCTLVSIYQEYSQMQAPGCFTGHNSSSQKTVKTANSVKWKSGSSSSTSQTGWGKTWASSASWTLAKGPWIYWGVEGHALETEDLLSLF